MLTPQMVLLLDRPYLDNKSFEISWLQLHVICRTHYLAEDILVFWLLKSFCPLFQYQ